VAELAAHQALAVWSEKKTQYDAQAKLVAAQRAWQQTQTRDVTALETEYAQLSHVDIAAELQAHADLAAHTQQSQLRVAYDHKIESLRKEITKEDKNYNKLVAEVATLQQHRCYACGQDFHDDQHTSVLAGKVELQSASQRNLDDLRSQLDALVANPVVVGDRPATHYSTEAEAIRHSSELNNIQAKIRARHNETDPYAEHLSAEPVADPGAPPATHYDTEAAAVKHSTQVNNLLQQITTKHNDVDPYSEQITDMQQQALQIIDYDAINQLTRVQEHQEFLLKLLTSKDSFVRKKIIDQNLSYLNSRLTHYLDAIGLPHTVSFQNDLSVNITELGRELDFDNLSRGERNRLILSLSWAFRDVFESLYQPINLLFIDELMDSGLDTAGMENALAILKGMSRERSKSVWLVSHRDELAGRVNNILRVIKEGGFTSYNTDTELS
jgi:hypothetical protein